jgi:hypothetical protein
MLGLREGEDGFVFQFLVKTTSLASTRPYRSMSIDSYPSVDL